MDWRRELPFLHRQTELQRQQWRCAESEAALKAERGVLEVARGLVMGFLKAGCFSGEDIQPWLVPRKIWLVNGLKKEVVNGVNGL